MLRKVAKHVRLPISAAHTKMKKTNKENFLKSNKLERPASTSAENTSYISGLVKAEQTISVHIITSTDSRSRRNKLSVPKLSVHTDKKKPQRKYDSL